MPRVRDMPARIREQAENVRHLVLATSTCGSPIPSKARTARSRGGRPASSRNLACAERASPEHALAKSGDVAAPMFRRRDFRRRLLQYTTPRRVVAIRRDSRAPHPTLKHARACEARNATHHPLVRAAALPRLA